MCADIATDPVDLAKYIEESEGNANMSIVPHGDITIQILIVASDSGQETYYGRMTGLTDEWRNVCWGDMSSKMSMLQPLMDTFDIVEVPAGASSSTSEN